MGSLTGEELVELEGDIDARVRGHLEDWCLLALSAAKQRPAAHHRLLIGALEDVASGECQRLFVEMPPGSAKSTYVSDLFPPWFMAKTASQSVIATSHTSGHAEYFSRRAMGRITEHGSTLGISLVGEAAESWGTSNGGEYKAAGVGGAITGRRADLAIIDDPVKGRQQADSPIERAAMMEWYDNDFLTRLKPQGRIIIVMTRWHEADLGGQILDRERDDWRVLRLPMEAEDADDPLGREIGERLWPEWFTEKMVADAKLDPRKWASLYQQRPAPAEGALFLVGKIVVPAGTPVVVRKVRAWDLAATEEGTLVGAGAKKKADPDWTVGVLLGRLSDGRTVVLDVKRVRGGPEVVNKLILDTAAEDGRAVEIGLPQDPGAAGKSDVAHKTSLLAGFTVKSSTETGSKTTRAGPVASQCNVGNLLMVGAPWNTAFVEELRNFPAGRFDDQVDALSRAFNMLVVAAKPARSMNVPYGAR